MIQVEHVNKTFKVAKRSSGVSEAFRALFRKEYDYIKALDDVSFTIEDGEMVGYIGPNGAGKSSTIKILSGILTPDGGSCHINGRVPWKDRIQHVRDIGVVFGQRTQLWWDVPVIDSFDLLRDIYNIPDSDYRKKRDELTELLDLKEILKTPARQLSLGQRMRCEIGASLLHSPKILFLDEPTIGLDAVSKIAVRNFILDMNRVHSTTVILTTHDMQDIEALTKRIILIGKGTILYDGDLEVMRSRFCGNKKLVVTYTGDKIPPCEGMQPISHDFSLDNKGVGSGHAVYHIDTKLWSVSEAIQYLSKEAALKDVSVMDASIDEVVVNLYREYEI